MSSLSKALHSVDEEKGKEAATYVFVFDGMTWRQIQKLTATDAAAYRLFRATVALTGSRTYRVVEGRRAR
jgi:hypothetical protein